MNPGMNPGVYIQALLDLADEVAGISPDMRVPDQPARPVMASPVQSTAAQTERERMVHSLVKEYRGKSRAEILAGLGQRLGAEVADAMQSQAPTTREAFTKYQQRKREAARELGKGLAAAGVEVKQHTEQDYMRAILAQLDLLLEGVIPSVIAVINAAHPDDPKKAKSIQNSQRSTRWKVAWKSPDVMNHPIEVAMRLTHDKNDMNRRLSPKTFGQSLSMNAALFRSSDRITKQGAEIDQLKARVQLLEEQMQATKHREALADAGATSSRDKVLALRDQGNKQGEIAKLLGMPCNTVKSIIRRSKSR